MSEYVKREMALIELKTKHPRAHDIIYGVDPNNKKGFWFAKDTTDPLLTFFPIQK